MIALLLAGFGPMSAAAADQADGAGTAGLNKDACTFNGFPLYGNIQIVDSFPDIKVKVVDSFAELHVEIVTSFPDKCGQWQMVNTFPDVKIQYVDSFPDVKIKFVDSFPGMR